MKKAPSRTIKTPPLCIPVKSHEVISYPTARTNKIGINIANFDIEEMPGASLAVTFPCFAVVAMSPVPVAVQVCPQAYPLGQHPPPSLAAHELQPCAQLPVWPEDPTPGPVGATIVTPFEFKTVVEVVGGHDVRLQSRPTRQHPP